MKRTTKIINLIQLIYPLALVLNLLKDFFERSRISFDKLRTSARKINLYSALLFTLLCIFNSNADIIESDTLSSVLNYNPTPRMLIIFDIDNTLGHPTQEAGSDEWFSFKVKEKMLEGHDELTAVYYALPAAYYAQFNVPLELIEQTTPDLIKHLINNEVAVMALSTRSLCIAERTLEQLNNIDVHFFIPTIAPHDYVLPMPHPCFYKEGVLFSGNNDKGEALICFFDTMNFYPETVIFVDDKMKYLLSVEKALSKHNITFYGIRYSGCDERVKNFDPTTAEAQYCLLKTKNQLPIHS